MVKGSKTSTARRRGGRNTNKAPSTNVVDRVTCVSTLETVSLSPSTSTNPTCLQPQLVATSLQHSNPAFVNSSFQCNQPSGATYPSMVQYRQEITWHCVCPRLARVRPASCVYSARVFPANRPRLARILPASASKPPAGTRILRPAS